MFIPLVWILPYIIAGGFMWLIASQTAAFGREIRLSKAILAVVLAGVCSWASNYWLKPLIGDWRYLAEFVAWTLVVMQVLELSFWRSVLAVFIYWVVMTVAVIVMGIITKSGGPPPARASRGGNIQHSTPNIQCVAEASALEVGR